VGVEGWEIVFRGDRLQADILAAVLEANGLRAEVFGDTAYSYAINFTEARVMVPTDQVSQAQDLIRQAQAEISSPPEV
jgi:Putative prokaryotic signal transducing protein